MSTSRACEDLLRETFVLDAHHQLEVLVILQAAIVQVRGAGGSAGSGQAAARQARVAARCGRIAGSWPALRGRAVRREPGTAPSTRSCGFADPGRAAQINLHFPRKAGPGTGNATKMRDVDKLMTSDI